MTVKLLSNTPLEIADKAISKCWDKYSKDGEVNTKRMYNVGNQNKHSSTLEHIVYSFDIDGISRACLQELARHRMSSFSVKSSRYTLGELTKCNGSSTEMTKFLVNSVNDNVNLCNIIQLKSVRAMLINGVKPDVVKYALPEAYKTSLVWTVNMRSLQNFLELRTSNRALAEIRQLAYMIYEQLPEEHKFMFEEFVSKVETRDD